MRRLLSAATVLATMIATPAFASDTGTTAINASLAPNCEIIAQSSTLTLGGVNDPVPGVFTYRCNFVGQPNLTFTSQNAGVMTTENGGATVNYGIYLNDLAPSGLPTAWLQASNTPQSYPNISSSTTPNVPVNPYFQVGLTQPITVAGTYSDTLTISITP